MGLKIKLVGLLVLLVIMLFGLIVVALILEGLSAV